MGSRRNARILVLQALYQIDIHPRPIEDVLSFEWLDIKYNDQTYDFARKLVSGTMKHRHGIDDYIVKQLEHWDLDRLSFVDRAILRFSTFSLLYQEDVPDTVIINEAIDIAKIYGSDDSYRFVNGVLDGIRKEKQKKEEREPE